MKTLHREEHFTRSRQETVDLGKRFALSLRPGDVLTLSGNLGSGKTQFVIGICEGLQAHGHVASPTFTLIHVYDVSFGKLVHVDLYRINKKSEIRELGIEEYFADDCICMIEWPEIAADILPPERYDVSIAFGQNEDDRTIVIEKVLGF